MCGVCPYGTSKADGTDGAAVADCTACLKGYYAPGTFTAGSSTCNKCLTPLAAFTNNANAAASATRNVMCNVCPEGTA